MDVKSLTRACLENPEAFRRWVSGLSEDQARRLDELIRESEERFWEDLVNLTAIIDSTPEPTESALAEMEARAKGFGTCETVMVRCLRAYRHRLLDELAAAEEVLAKASALVPACRSASPGRPNPCYLEVHWRWGMLDMSLGRRREGLAKVEMALAGYQDLGKPGHNLDGDGVTAMRLARARILFELKEYDAAASDYSACLKRFSLGSALWSSTRDDLATALANSGPEGREQAWELLGKQRLSFRKRDVTVQKARFLHTDGELTIVLKKQRGLKKLKDALECFATLGMPHDYWNVALAIAQVLYPNREKIEEFLLEIEPVFRSLMRDERHEKLFDDLKAMCQGFPRPKTFRRLAGFLNRIREALAEEASLPPSLLVLTILESDNGRFRKLAFT